MSYLLPNIYLCRTDSLFDEYHDFVLDSMQLKGVPTHWRYQNRGQNLLVDFRGNKRLVILSTALPTGRFSPPSLLFNRVPLPLTGPLRAKACLHASDVDYLVGEGRQSLFWAEACFSIPYNTITLGDKITHPLGQISDPVSSKTCLKEGTHNENGGFGIEFVEKVA